MPAPSCTLPIAVVPNAPRNEIIGWLGNAVKLKIHAPPLEGRANAALCEFLADELDLPRRAVTVAVGSLSRRKIVHIEGLDLAAVLVRLGLSRG
jgi:uncharacterized protein (TIGR00251 family)